MTTTKTSFRRLKITCLLFLVIGLGYRPALASDILQTDIAFLQYQPPRPPVLSNILPPPEDAGLQGARQGLKDNNTTGRFLKHRYQLNTFSSKEPSAVLKQAKQWLENGQQLLVVDLSTELLQQVNALANTHNALVFNVGNSDDALRTSQCLGNVLHTIPSRAMLADALGQWLIRKQLQDWLLIRGDTPADRAFAEAVKRAAKRYGGDIVAEKTWTFDTDLRRTAQTELPVFTQTREYDVVVVADEAGDFGEYVPYNTWYPRPVVGTQGLTPVAWHRVVEQWGAAQLQNRFEDTAGRWMNGKDYAAWVAVRTIGEAVTQTQATDAATVRDFILSDRFQLGGFKGRKLTYRHWNGQLRQPIPLVHPRALVSQSPQAGFLHPKTELDTLGFDQPESQCSLAKLQ